jgi:DNA-binding HxlR family transcriptional regulator
MSAKIEQDGSMYPEFRSPCPVASALDVFGDKWTLIVLRTIFAGRSRYSELADIPEKIATNILADRLERLERFGLIEKTPYQESPIRYRYSLTWAGADVLPILQALGAWSGRHIPERWNSPEWFLNGKAEQFYPPPAAA